MDLPLPVDPIIATVIPGSAVNDTSFNTYSSLSEYLNETFLNSTFPLVFPSLILPSLILHLVSNTSLILSAEIEALGYIINIIASIKKDDITCIAYDVNTTILLNKSIFSANKAESNIYAPVKYIASETPFIIKYITGEVILITF